MNTLFLNIIDFLKQLPEASQYAIRK